MAAIYHPGLHRLATGTAAATLLLLVAGALVTSNQAGLAVPDWPLSYGTLAPPMVGGVFFEHSHRLVAGSVLILTVILVAWLARRESRAWVRRLGWLALAAVLAQALLGGLTVLLQLPPAVSIAHATLGQLFFCALASLALFTSRWWHSEVAPVEEDEAYPLRQPAALTCAAVFVQLILGAGFRHGAFGILPHLLGAAVVATLAYRTAAVARGRYGQVPSLRGAGAALAHLTTTQLVLGGASLWARLATAPTAQPGIGRVALTVAHVAIGGMTFAAAVILTLCAYRTLKPAQQFAAESNEGRATI